MEATSIECSPIPTEAQLAEANQLIARFKAEFNDVKALYEYGQWLIAENIDPGDHYWPSPQAFSEFQIRRFIAWKKSPK